MLGIKEDLLTTREELQFARDAIHGAAYVVISSPVGGHTTVVGGIDPKADEAMNREIAKFLSTVK